MKTHYVPLAVGLIAAPFLLTAAPSLPPGSQNLKINQTWEPIYPFEANSLGIREGHVTVVVSIDADGRLQDALVVAYTHPSFADPALAAVKHWTYDPPRFDGQPIAITKPIAFNFEQHGVVLVSENPTEVVASRIQSMRPNADSYRAYNINEIDHDLTPTHLVLPSYSNELRARGVKGSVRVTYYVDEEGNVRVPTIDNDAPTELADSVMAAVRQWRFEPPLRRGRPVLVRVSQGINFTPTS